MVGARWANFWENLRSSYWFIPSLMTAGSIGLASGLLILDKHIDVSSHKGWSLLYTGGPDGARTLLSTVASSMITVAGVVFSITIVALAMASSQFGPRLLRSFMRDRGNQVVLGTFVSTFVYCILVLRTIRGFNDTTVVPAASVAVGILLSILSLGVLIYFIHHVAFSIQAPNIIRSVWTDLREAIDELFPETLGEGPEADESWLEKQIPDFDADAVRIPARRDGYLRAVDESELMEYAVKHDLVIDLRRRPGQYITDRMVIARVHPAGRVEREELIREINGMLVYGSQRTLSQDVEFAVRQMVEVAVRALSPGINDPDTAMTSIDHLGSALCMFANRRIPGRYRHRDRKLRVIAKVFTFPGMADAALHQIRQYGQSSPAVMIHLLQMLSVVAGCVVREGDQAAIRGHARLCLRAAERGIDDDSDLAEARERYGWVINTLERRGRTPGVEEELVDHDDSLEVEKPE